MRLSSQYIYFCEKYVVNQIFKKNPLHLELVLEQQFIFLIYNGKDLNISKKTKHWLHLQTAFHLKKKKDTSYWHAACIHSYWLWLKTSLTWFQLTYLFIFFKQCISNCNKFQFTDWIKTNYIFKWKLKSNAEGKMRPKQGRFITVSW